jgi:hypothetical protein
VSLDIRISLIILEWLVEERSFGSVEQDSQGKRYGHTLSINFDHRLLRVDQRAVFYDVMTAQQHDECKRALMGSAEA